MIRSLASPLLLTIAACFASMAAFLLWLARERSALPYDAEGNYFDGTVSYNEQSVLAFATLGVASLVVAAFLLGIRSFVRRAQQRAE